MKLCVDRIGVSMQHFDFGLQANLEISHSVDITEECPRAGIVGTVLLEFAQGTEGVVCEINRMLEGTQISQPMDVFNDIYTPEMLTFRSWADDFGLSAESLTLIIQGQAPQLDREQHIADLRRYSYTPDRQFESCLRMSGFRPGDLMP